MHKKPIESDRVIRKESTVSAAIKNVDSATKADYCIDYDAGNIKLGDLPIGTRLVDLTWQWEFRVGNNYTGSGETKPVTWLVVARDHYGHGSGVTLLSAEPIGKYNFDNNKRYNKKRFNVGRISSNHWANSGTGKATCGLRPWLNSTGIHNGEGFYQAFSESFKRAVLTTTVPNRVWKKGRPYSTNDRIFIPSTTELNDTVHNWTYPIGSAYPYFQGAGDAKRTAKIGWETWYYWTRSPVSGDCYRVRVVSPGGGFGHSAARSFHGVRPALNLKSEILVSEIRN